MKTILFVSLSVLLLCSELLFAGCQIDSVPVQISVFHDRTSDTRFKNNPAKLSGDGKKIVFIQSASGFDTSLTGWLSSRETALTTDNAAKVYLYDIDNQQSTLIYTGSFSFISKDNAFSLQSLESGFTVDINHDGSQVILASTKTSFNSQRDRLSNHLIFSSINTKDGTVTQLLSVPISGFQAQNIPLKLSGDGSQVAFIYAPTSNKTSSIFGVEFFDASQQSILATFAVQANTTLTKLSQGKGDNASDSEILATISAEHSQSFAIDYTGNNIIFGYPNTGIIIGVKSDTSNYHTIANVPPNNAIHVAISDDGNTVAYTDRSQETSILYKNNFSGSNQSIILNKGTNNSGNLFLNAAGTALIFNNKIANPGFTFGFSAPSYFVYTDGSMIVSPLNKDLLDVSANFNRVLTSYYNSSALDVNLLSSGSRYLPDSKSIYLSSLYMTGNRSIAYEIILKIISSNPYTFKLSNYAPTRKATINAVYYPENKLTIPYIAIGNDCHTAELKLIDSSNYLFELTDLQKFN